MLSESVSMISLILPPVSHPRRDSGLSWRRPFKIRRFPVIDHIGFPVSDYERAKAFYLKALAPLGYTLIMEVRQDEHDAPAAGFGKDGKPDFWIGGEGG